MGRRAPVVLATVTMLLTLSSHPFFPRPEPLRVLPPPDVPTLPEPADPYEREAWLLLRRYRGADPVADLRAALVRGDERFICVMGEAGTYPGLRQVDLDLVARHGEWTFPHVSDAMRGRLDGELASVAQRYAEAYNRRLREHLTTGR